MAEETPPARTRLLTIVAASGVGLLFFAFLIGLALFSRVSPADDELLPMVPYTGEGTLIAWRTRAIPDRAAVDDMLGRLPLKELGVGAGQVTRCVLFQGRIGNVALVDGEFDREAASKSLESLQKERVDRGDLKIYSIAADRATMPWTALIRERLVFASSADAVQAVRDAAASGQGFGGQPVMQELLRRLSGDDILMITPDGSMLPGTECPAAASLRMVSSRLAEGCVVFQAKDGGAAAGLVETVKGHKGFPWVPQDLDVRQDGPYVIGTFKTAPFGPGK